MLFCDTKDTDTIDLAETIPTVITEKVIKAAQNYVDVCCEHAAYLAGRNLIEEVVKKYLNSAFKYTAT